ncbi:MAG: chemotaxis response regulator protein-glutamate methylesterase [Planctomycetes bacterium]|nr:chemotaxis response regulator protein-glutamate methylesterase [Planctomycetota bacterium]
MTQLAIPIQQKTIRVLIVDDSVLTQKYFTRQLSRDPQINVVGCAANPFEARDRILAAKPDVLTLDINMPRMDGITFLQKLMKYNPIPVIVVSSFTQKNSKLALAAFEAGAIEVVCKPNSASLADEMFRDIIRKIKAVSMARLPSALARVDRIRQKKPNPIFKNAERKIVALGASTGGVEALSTVLIALPSNMPPTLVVQHMPPGFTKAFADRLDCKCAMKVKEAERGDELRPGLVLIAPGDKHMILRKSDKKKKYYVILHNGPLVCYQKPSIETLFLSIADCAAKNTVAAILTGMGSDGAKALEELRQKGARTIAQDEKTSLIFGMPKEAIAQGGVEFVLPLGGVADKLIDLLAD